MEKILSEGVCFCCFDGLDCECLFEIEIFWIVSKIKFNGLNESLKII